MINGTVTYLYMELLRLAQQLAHLKQRESNWEVQLTEITHQQHVTMMCQAYVIAGKQLKPVLFRTGWKHQHSSCQGSASSYFTHNVQTCLTTVTQLFQIVCKCDSESKVKKSNSTSLKLPFLIFFFFFLNYLPKPFFPTLITETYFLT